MDSRYSKVTQTLSFGSTGEHIERIPLPRTRVDEIAIRVDYTVTDADITAGENFQGMIKQMIIGDEEAALVDVRKDELQAVIDLMVDGISTGFYSDDTPTTAVQQHAYFIIPGPFQLSEYFKPELILTLNPVDEFGGASAFVASVTVDVVESKPSELHKPGARVYRYTSGSATTHAVSIGPGTVKDMLIIAGAANVISEIRLPAQGPLGGKSDVDFEVKTTYPAAFIDAWAKLQRSSRDTTKYFIPGLDSRPYVGRELEVDMSAANTLKVFARNVVGGY